MRPRKHVALLLAAGLLAAGPAPHPGHSSYAEVSCNAARKELQVSLGMLAIDFEKTLSQRAGKRVNLDTTKDVGKLIESYLADRFVVTLANGSKPSPSFVGREDQGKNVWIYFTVPLAKQPAKTPTGKPTGKPAAKPVQQPASKKPTHGKGAPSSLLTGVRLRNQVLMELNREQRNLVELREGTWRHFLTFTEKAREQAMRPAKQDKPKPKASPQAGKVASVPSADVRRR